MGGNNLSVPSVRLNKEDFEILSLRLEREFSYGDTIPSYEEKQTFGDLDYLYITESGYGNSQYVVHKLHNCGLTVFEKPVFNGSVTSYGVSLPQGIFQIDFIGVPNQSYDFAYNYFAFNDMGNLLGRVARRIGLKLGHNGLWYIQRSPDNDSEVLKEHLLTLNWDEALEHLGYDVERHHDGFDTLEDIFEFVMSSRFYDFDKFDLSRRNHKSRIRDAKRPNYRAFLEYAQTHQKVNNIDTVGHYRTYHFGRFPEFYDSYFVELDKHKVKLLFKEKYNGNVVSEITGLSGKELGQFMAWSDDFFGVARILQFDEEAIRERILWCYKEWNRQP